MAERTAMAEIRGIDINKMVRGFADENLIMKKHVLNAKTSSREIRWYKETAGVLEGPKTTGITASQIANTSSLSQPIQTEPEWSREQSFVRKFFVESPWISEEDIMDSDIDILSRMSRKLGRSVAYQVNKRIYEVLVDQVTSVPFDGTDVPSAAAAGTGWVGTGVDIVGDLTSAKKSIKSFNYNDQGATLLINEAEEKMLVDWVINVKGSSIPGFSSEKVRDGVIMEFVGLKVVVNSFATTDYAVVFDKNACTYKQFKPIQSEVVKDAGVGRKIRVWEMGEAILTDPNAVYGITDTTP